jgi:hypothetical protein
MNEKTLLFVLIFAFLKALLDLTAHGKLGLFKSDFWNESVAWRNKWKNGDQKQGERFFGSSTVFVFLTSGWHLIQEILLVSIFLLFFGFTLEFLIYITLFKITFELLYRWL